MIDEAIRQDRFEHLTPVVRDNKVGWQQAKLQSPAWNFGEQPGPEDTPTGNELKGLAGSPGIIEG